MKEKNLTTFKKQFGALKLAVAIGISSFSSFIHAEPPLPSPFLTAIGYVNPDYVAEINAFFARNPGYADKAKKLDLLDNQNHWKIPTAIWLDSMQAITGYPAPRSTHSMLYYLKDVAAKATVDKPIIITFVIYDLPLRDCDAYSSNGEFKSPEDISKYKTNYIGEIPKATTEISSAAHPITFSADPTTIVDTLKAFSLVPNAKNVRIAFVVEPDSLPNLITNTSATQACQLASDNKTYVSGISYALQTLSSDSVNINKNIYLYLDIAHSGWLGWADNANKISSIYNKTALPGFNNVRGFITNTANYSPVKEAFNYDQYLAGILHGDPQKTTSYYSWNNVYDESSYIAEIMSIGNDGKISVDGNHRISKPVGTPFYADKYFLIDTSRNGWLTNSDDYQYKDYSGVPHIYSRKDQRHHRGNWCNAQNIQTSSTAYEDHVVPSKRTSAGLGDVPIVPNIQNPLYGSDLLPIDAYVWIKPPGESDGYYDPKSNSAGDQMCGSGNGGSHDANEKTDALQDGNKPAPKAGIFFDAAFRNLIDVAGCVQGVFTSGFCKPSTAPILIKRE